MAEPRPFKNRDGQLRWQPRYADKGCYVTDEGKGWFRDNDPDLMFWREKLYRSRARAVRVGERRFRRQSRRVFESVAEGESP